MFGGERNFDFCINSIGESGGMGAGGVGAGGAGGAGNSVGGFSPITYSFDSGAEGFAVAYNPTMLTANESATGGSVTFESTFAGGMTDEVQAGLDLSGADWTGASTVTFSVNVTTTGGDAGYIQTFSQSASDWSG